MKHILLFFQIKEAFYQYSHQIYKNRCSISKKKSSITKFNKKARIKAQKKKENQLFTSCKN